MIARHQLPAWSPLNLRALAAGIIPPPSSRALGRIERRIADEYRPRSLLLTRSGTIALALAMRASAPEGLRPRIGLPAWGCFDLMTAADAVDAEVVLYDLDPETLAPEQASFRGMLAREPHAAVVAHWFGVPVDLGPWAELARSAGALLVDDAAQAVGASLRGAPLGIGGDFGILSFGRGKGRTGGEGGALLAASPSAQAALQGVARALAPPGRGFTSFAAVCAQWAFGRPPLYWVPVALPSLRLGETIYRPPPEFCAMSSRSAAVLEAVWDFSARETEVRRANAERWRQILQVPAASATTIAPPEGGVAGWLRYPVLADDPLRGRLDSRAARRHGVVRGYPRSLSELPVAAGRTISPGGEFEGARRLAHSLFSFPTHRMVRTNDFEAIASLID